MKLSMTKKVVAASEHTEHEIHSAGKNFSGKGKPRLVLLLHIWWQSGNKREQRRGNGTESGKGTKIRRQD